MLYLETTYVLVRKISLEYPLIFWDTLQY